MVESGLQCKIRDIERLVSEFTIVSLVFLQHMIGQFESLAQAAEIWFSRSAFASSSECECQGFLSKCRLLFWDDMVVGEIQPTIWFSDRHNSRNIEGPLRTSALPMRH